MMPEVEDIDIDDIIVPGQEEEQNVDEQETMEFTELYDKPSVSSDYVEDEIDEDAVEFSELNKTDETEEEVEEVVVEEVVEEESVVEENVHQVIEETTPAPENSNERSSSR